MKNDLHFDIDVPDNLFNEMVKEREYIGYYNLPSQNLEKIKKFEKKFEKKHRNIQNIAVIGIGGSSLGAKAIYNFIKSSKTLKRKLYFMESTDPSTLQNLINDIDIKSTHFLVVSKSGSTIETISIFKYIYNILQRDIKYFSFITEKGSNLHKFAKSINAQSIFIPKSVGGRFSVLSNIGLVPLKLVGIDIEKLLDGAKRMEVSFFRDGYIKNILLKKATYISTNYNRFNINTIFAYSESLKYFCEWYVQLWGESLGKKQNHSTLNVGLTPIGLIGPKDQHSFLQLIMEGVRDKSVTFIMVDDFKLDMSIPDISLDYLKELDTINGVAFNTLINKQAKATLESLKDVEIPLDVITLPTIDELYIGELIYYYELLTSAVGILLDINTYNQPGVENGKIILKDMLK
ncbi:Glucose-6-phosphate isomerase [hydrothermal vent metagenome]|uniref:glucose-6-phosphate isomerase n=1 Tax=hydrothermal vent metagenome TaxID=652676 RepID=A0A1W1EHG1_9ZZZZ